MQWRCFLGEEQCALRGSVPTLYSLICHDWDGDSEVLVGFYIRMSFSDHGYEPTENIGFTLDQQYADDISWAPTSTTVLEKIETIIPEVLKERNLFVNESKTDKYTISRNSPNEWKDCKLVGS